MAVVLAVGQHVFDHAAQRRQADAAGDENQILALEFGIHGKAVAIGAAHGDLLANVHLVQPAGEATALFDGELHMVGAGGRRGDGEHRLAHARDGEHGALARHVLEAHARARVRAHDREGLDVRRIAADGRDHADGGDQSVVVHCFFPPSVRITLAMCRCIGHLLTQRPQPTQEYMPSLLAGKYTSLCMNR